MSLKNRVSHQMNLLKSSWIVPVLLPILTFASGYLTFSIVTALFLISSAFLTFTLSKSKSKVKPQAPEEEEKPRSENQHGVLNSGQNVPNQVGLPDSYSESEVIDRFSSTSEEEDSDFDCWEISGGARRSQDCSDGSISDEESLIEIALPSGHYVGSKSNGRESKEAKVGFPQKSPEFSPGSIFWWSEMNEEENLIEIDIKVGSIKCSRIEIKA